MSISVSTAIFFTSLLAIPLTYVVNTAQSFHGEWTLFLTGVGALCLVLGIIRYSVNNKKQDTDPFTYALMFGSFASVVDLIIALENDEYLEGFMTEYLKDGEPYLTTAYGTAICYWDGLAHYAMYLTMMYLTSRNQPFREVALYWAGSLGHSMIVFMPGNVIGKFGIRWSILLNVPYIFIPFLCMGRFLNERPKYFLQDPKANTSIWRRPVDMLCVAGLLLSLFVAFCRGFAVLGSNNEYLQWYVSEIEPYFNDPVTYPKVQMLVYMFYFVPFYSVAIYGLFYPTQDYMSDWGLIHAGAAAQAQFAHIGSSLHHRTPYALRVPPARFSLRVFWLVNLFLLIFPQLLAYRFYRSDSTALDKQTKKDK